MSPFRGLQKGAVPDFPGYLSRGQRPGTIALDELFIGVVRMELHQRDPALGPGQGLCQSLRDVGLAGAGRALEYDLFLVFEQDPDLLQKRRRQVGPCSEGIQTGLMLNFFPVTWTIHGGLIQAPRKLPNYRLGIETVAQFQATIGGLLDELV